MKCSFGPEADTNQRSSRVDFRAFNRVRNARVPSGCGEPSEDSFCRHWLVSQGPYRNVAPPCYAPSSWTMMKSSNGTSRVQWISPPSMVDHVESPGCSDGVGQWETAELSHEPAVYYPIAVGFVYCLCPFCLTPSLRAARVRSDWSQSTSRAEEQLKMAAVRTI